MTDRVSSEKVGQFVVHTDRDHRGSYRGLQAMSKNYHGWHYHVDAVHASQDDLFDFLETQLRRLGATQYDAKYVSVGFVEASPRRMSYWTLGRKSMVLWIGDVTGTLHIEANKPSTFCRPY